MARGYCEVYPQGNQVAVEWAPHGQASRGGGRDRWNFLCTRGVVRPTLGEALDELLKATAPRWWSMEDLVEQRRNAIEQMFHAMAQTVPCPTHEATWTYGFGNWLRYCKLPAGHDGGHSYEGDIP